MTPFLRRLALAVCLGPIACGALAKAPPVPPGVETLVQILFRRPEFERCQLSPAGRYLAFLREDDGHKVLATIDLETRQLCTTNRALGQDVVDFDWCGPETLIFQVGSDKLYYRGLWLADTRLQHPRPVPVENRVLAIYQVRKSQVFLVDRDPDEGFFSDLYRVNTRSGNIDFVEKNPGRVIDWLTDDRGRARVAIRAESDEQYRLLYRDGDDTQWKVIPLPEKPGPLAFDPSGRFLLLQYLGRNGRFRVQAFDLESHELTGGVLSDPVYDVLPEILSDPKTFAPMGLRYQTDRPRIYWLEMEFSRMRDTLEPKLPGAFIQPWGTTSGGRVFFTSYSDTQPMDCRLADPATGQVTVLLRSMPEADEHAWSPMRGVVFPARDGYLLHGYLTLPPGRRDGRRVPLVALCHGGPRERDSWGFDSEVQFYAALGYGVLQVNYRGSAGFGLDHQLASIIEVCKRSVDDVADGLDWAVAKGYADPARLVAMGGSYGAYISVALAARYPELPAAVVGFAGIYDYEEHIRLASAEHPGAYQWLGRFFPDAKTHASQYRDISPVHLADRIRAPVLLLHGGGDHTVDIGQSRLMEGALLRAGKSVRLVSDVASVHGLPDQQSRFDYYRTVAAFLLEHVPPDAPR